MEVWFYHLQTQPLERVLPTLLERALQRDWRVVVQVTREERMHALDDLLWTYAPDAFLPHGCARDGDPEGHLIWLTTTAEDPIDAHLHVCADGAAAGPAVRAGRGYERVILLFDGTDEEALAAARAEWKALKDEGIALSYWQQTESGGWEKKA
jgi:DNA polymerase-3 subunit chi